MGAQIVPEHTFIMCREPLTEKARALGTIKISLPRREHVHNTEHGSSLPVLSRFSCIVACRFISFVVFSPQKWRMVADRFFLETMLTTN